MTVKFSQQYQGRAALPPQPTSASLTSCPGGNDMQEMQDGDGKARPRRPLTAYNLFFQMERQVILRSMMDPSELAANEAQVNEDRASLAAPGNGGSCEEMEVPERYRGIPFPSGAAPRRKHRKSHGKIGFKELSQMISNRWAETDEATKAFFKARAAKALNAYKEEMRQLEAPLACNSGVSGLERRWVPTGHLLPPPLNSGPLNSGPLNSGPLNSGPLNSGPMQPPCFAGRVPGKMPMKAPVQMVTKGPVQIPARIPSEMPSKLPTKARPALCQSKDQSHGLAASCVSEEKVKEMEEMLMRFQSSSPAVRRRIVSDSSSRSLASENISPLDQLGFVCSMVQNEEATKSRKRKNDGAGSIPVAPAMRRRTGPLAPRAFPPVGTRLPLPPPIQSSHVPSPTRENSMPALHPSSHSFSIDKSSLPQRPLHLSEMPSRAPYGQRPLTDAWGTSSPSLRPLSAQLPVGANSAAPNFVPFRPSLPPMRGINAPIGAAPNTSLHAPGSHNKACLPPPSKLSGPTSHSPSTIPRVQPPPPVSSVANTNRVPYSPHTLPNDVTPASAPYRTIPRPFTTMTAPRMPGTSAGKSLPPSRVSPTTSFSYAPKVPPRVQMAAPQRSS